MMKNFFMAKKIYRNAFYAFGLFIFLGLATQSVHAEGSIFAQTIGGTGTDIANSIIQTADDGYVVVGYGNSYGTGNHDMYIAKFTDAGALDTSFGSNGTRTIGGTGADIAYSVVQASDGGYVVVGKTSSYGVGGNDVYVVKLTSSGAIDTSFGISGTLTIGGANHDTGSSIIQTADGGYAIAGTSNNRFYIVKLTSFGALDTSFGSNGTRTIGGVGTDIAYSVVQSSDGGYVLAGYTGSYGAGGNDVYVVKLTSSGALDTSFGSSGIRTIGGTGNDVGYSVIQTSDGGYAVAGYTASYGSGGFDMYVVKLTSSGALDTSFGSSGTRTIGGTNSDYGYSIIQTSDDGYAIAGKTYSYGAGSTDVYIAKLTGSGSLDTSFNTSGTLTIGGTGTDAAYSVIQTSDDGYALAGQTNSYGAGGNDVYVIKIEQAGSMGDCSHNSGDGGLISSGGTLNATGYIVGSVGTVSSGGTASSGGIFNQQCIVLPLSDITIPDPEPTDMQDTVTNGQVTIDNGTIDNTDQVTTQVNVTVTSGNGQAVFPTNTVITEQNSGNFNFENFTISDATVENGLVAVELGIPGINLSFSQDITVSLDVGTGYNDATLAIYSQSTGQTDWSNQGTCVVADGLCTFTTNHATTYVVGGNPAQEPIEIYTEVLDTLSLDCYETDNGSGDHTVTLSDATTGHGYVTAGIPSIGKSTCDATTNDDKGYYLTIENSTGGTTGHVLEHEDPNIPGTYYSITDTENDLYYYNGTNTQLWTDGTTKGLGFSVIAFPDTNTTNNTLDDNWTLTGTLCQDGTAGGDQAVYAAVPTSPQPITAVTQYQANTTTTEICYKVDVLPSQQSGQYAGQVTFTATTDASSYLN
jgi:uncharacterized delta-60 repeat protein